MREILHDELLLEGGGQPLFEVRGLMEIEYEVACRDKLDLVLLHIEVDGLARVAKTPERERAVFSGLLSLLRALPRTGDLLVYKDGARIVVLVTRMSLEKGEQAARTLIDGARKLVLPGETTPLRVSLAIGIAAPRHDQELDFETLVHVADDGVSVALNSGAECVVHTELYSLYQKKIDRERPGGKPKRTTALPPPVNAVESGTLVPHKAADSPRQSTSAGRASPSASSAAGAIGASDASGISGTQPARSGQASASTPSAADLDARLKSALNEAAQGAPTVDALEAKLKELAHQWAEEALKQSLAAKEREHQKETELLERRIAKLSRTLESTEEELRTLANEREVEPGVASAYRGVQGLSTREEQYKAKLALLSQILEANLELRRQTRTAP